MSDLVSFREASFPSKVSREEQFKQARIVQNGDGCWLHSWDTSSEINGPGTRLTLFLAGCALRCKYCHNPDSVFKELGTFTSLDEIWSRVVRYKRLYDNTGGGVTASGGEPTFQWGFLRQLFTRAQEAGIHTTLDTCGYLGKFVKDDDFTLINLAMLDLKEGTPERYKNLTTRPMKPSILFGDRLNEHGVEIWGRFVLVPGVTDSEESIHGVAQIAKRWGTLTHVDILPFHQYGKNKWHELNIEYDLENTPTPTEEQTDRAKTILESYGLTVKVS